MWLQVAEALSALHDRARTVHLDLKPDNILLTSSSDPKLRDNSTELPQVRLTDFGISTRLPKRLSSFTVNKARTSHCELLQHDTRSHYAATPVRLPPDVMNTLEYS